MQNPYQILGVGEDATLSQIKEQYRELSKVFHPDKQQQIYYNLSVETFEKIDQAYKIIGNEFMKLVYDNFGLSGVQMVQENKQNFTKIELEYQQGKDILREMTVLLKSLQVQEAEQNSYQILQQYSFDAVLQNTFICTTNKIQYEGIATIAHARQILELPKWKQVEFALKSECSMFRINQQAPVARGMFRNYILAQFGYNLPFLQVCNFEIQYSIDDNKINRFSLKKKLSIGEVLVNFDESLKPTYAAAFGKQGRSVQVNIDGLNLTFSGDQQISEKQNFQIQLSQYQQSISYIYTVFKDQNYFSSFTLSYHRGKEKSMVFLTSEMKVNYQHVHLDWRSTVYQSGIMSIQFMLSKINSTVRFPFTFKIEDPFFCILWLIGPQVLPFLWSRGIINPWKKVIEDKRQVQESKVEEYQIYNKEIRESLALGDNYQKYLQFENILNGLLIIEAWVGEKQDIEQLIKNGVPNKFLVNVKEQLQAEIIDNGLFLPMQSIDRLDGFFKVQSKKNSAHFWGYVKYLYNNQQGIKKWNWNDPLSIGNVCNQNKQSLFETILGFIYK